MVRRYGDNQQQLQPLSGERLRAADFGRGGEMIGAAVENLGQSIGKVTSDLDEMGQRYDEAAVRTADAEDALKISQIKMTALAANGIDAHAAIENANKEIEQVGRARQESFSSNRQRTLYADQFARRQLGAQEALLEHGVKQTEVAEQAGYNATIDASTTVAIDAYDDKGEFDRNIAAIDQAVAAKFKGMPANVVSNMQRKARSDVHSGVVEKLLSDPDKAADAAIYLKDHATDILPAQETQLWRAVNPLIEEERTMGDASWALSGLPSPEHSDIDAPVPAGGEEDQPPAGPGPAPAAGRTSQRLRGFVNPLGPGVGKISNTAAQHRARGSENAVDIAAPAGTPIRPPMSGKVIKNWWSKEGGWSVMIQHPNGYVTGYAHMRSQSALAVGSEIDNTSIIGSVGNTGEKSHGNHLHYTVRKSIDGPKEDPQTLAWVDQTAVHPTSVNFKEGELPKYEEEDTNVATALGRLHERATAENWSARRYEKAAGEIRQRGAVNQQLYNKKQADQFDAAAAAIADADLSGTPLTMRSQVPGYSALDAGNKARVDTALAANKKAMANGGVDPNGPIFLDLFQMSGEAPGDFKKIDLRVVPGITPGERTRLIGIQKDMVGKDNEPTNFASKHARVYGMIDRFAGKGGAAGYITSQKATEQDRQRRGALFRAVADRVSERQLELKRELTDDELEAVVRSQVVSVTRSGKAMPRYVAERLTKKEGEVDQVEVPRDKQQAIIGAYQRSHGGAMPTQRQVVARYLQYLTLGGK